MRAMSAAAFVAIGLSAVHAEDLKIDQAQWSQLNDAQKGAIEKVIKGSFKNQNISIAAVPGGPKPAGALGNLFGQEALCKQFCEVSNAFAIAGCAGLAGTTVGLAGAVCGVLAAEAKNVCLKDCEQ